MPPMKSLYSVVLLLFITACGGGGEDSPTSAPPDSAVPFATDTALRAAIITDESEVNYQATLASGLEATEWVCDLPENRRAFVRLYNDNAGNYQLNSLSTGTAISQFAVTWEVTSNASIFITAAASDDFSIFDIVATFGQDEKVSRIDGQDSQFGPISCAIASVTQS